ncbi:hypothetical protein PCE1_004131 [Barthelona sp. PCE]
MHVPSAEFDVYRYSDKFIYEVSGCALGHHGTACTECVNRLMIKDDMYQGFYNFLTQGCILVREKHRNLAYFVLPIQLILLALGIKYYHVLQRIPWLSIVGKRDDNDLHITDFEVFSLMSIVKDYMLVLWPLVFNTDSFDTIIQSKTGIRAFLSLLINPLATVCMAIDFKWGSSLVLTTFISVFYMVGFFYSFLNYLTSKKATHFLFILLPAFVLVFVSRESLWEMLIWGAFATVFLIILATDYQLNALSSFFLLIAPFAFSLLWWDSRGGLTYTCSIMFVVILMFVIVRKPKVSVMTGLNYYFLPYIFKGILLVAVPVKFSDIYGLSNLSGYHSIVDFENPYNSYRVVLIVLIILFCFMSYSVARKLTKTGDASKTGYDLFIFILVIGRSLYTFLSYIVHDYLPNYIFLLSLLTYVQFTKPFKTINNLMLRISFFVTFFSVVSGFFFKYDLQMSLIVVLPCLVFVFNGLIMISRSKRYAKNGDPFLLEQF